MIKELDRGYLFHTIHDTKRALVELGNLFYNRYGVDNYDTKVIQLMSSIGDSLRKLQYEIKNIPTEGELIEFYDTYYDFVDAHLSEFAKMNGFNHGT